jgi:glycosyltransferase involved in cell wall biosynthesis
VDAAERRRPRIAVWAYTCNPERGSDRGATWSYVRALGRHADLTVFHSPEDAPELRRWSQQNPAAPIDFIEVPEPPWIAFVHRGFGVHRQLEFVTYAAWLRDAVRATRERLATDPFDAVAHASFSNYWLPSPVWRLGLPSLWGPIGGGVRTPLRLWPSLGPGGVIAELERTLALSVAAALPATRRTQRRVTVPIVETVETRDRLTSSRRDDAVLVNRVALIDPQTAGADVSPDAAGVRRSTEFLFTSSLWGKKGARLALEALVHADPRAHLAFVNDGYEQPYLERSARRLGVDHRVSFEGRIPREELFARMQSAAGLVFTGLREEGGLALAEAMYQGLPVVVLAHGGAGLIARQTTDPRRVRAVEPGGRHQTAVRIGRAMTELIENAPAERSPTLDPGPHLRGITAALASALPWTAHRGGVREGLPCS